MGMSTICVGRDPPPRVAMSLALAGPSFEAPAFDAPRFLPFPPLGLRVGLREAQAVVYKSSQVKSSQDFPPGYIKQCAAEPLCPVRGVVGCKRCSRSVS